MNYSGQAVRRVTKTSIGIAVAFLLSLSFVGPSSGYSITRYNTSKIAPNVYYDKATWSNSTMISYLSMWSSYEGRWVRYRISMRGASGTNQNDCDKSVNGDAGGWLPNGTYSNRDSNTSSHMNYIDNKNWGNAVVRGSVWNLGDKTCSNGSVTRTALYIHSQGTNGGPFSNGNYASQGCIKINEIDRVGLKDFWKSAHDNNRGQLRVYN